MRSRRTSPGCAPGPAGPRSWRSSRQTGTATGWCRAAGPHSSGGATWLGVATIEEALALRAAGITARTLAWLAPPGAAWQAAVEADVDLSASAVWALDGDRAPPPAPRVGRPGCTSRSTPVSGVVAPRPRTGRPWSTPRSPPQADGALQVVGLWSHLAHADAPGHPTTAAQIARFVDAHRARRAGRAATGGPPPGELRRRADAPGGALRPGPSRHRGVRDLADAGVRVVGRARAGSGHDGARAGRRTSSASRPGTASRTGTSTRPRARRRSPSIPLGYADGVPRHASGHRAGPARRAPADYRRAGLHGPVRRGRRRRPGRARRRGGAVRAGPARRAPSRGLGAGVGHDRVRDRGAHRRPRRADGTPGERRDRPAAKLGPREAGAAPSSWAWPWARWPPVRPRASRRSGSRCGGRSGRDDPMRDEPFGTLRGAPLPGRPPPTASRCTSRSTSRTRRPGRRRRSPSCSATATR